MVFFVKDIFGVDTGVDIFHDFGGVVEVPYRIVACVFAKLFAISDILRVYADMGVVVCIIIHSKIQCIFGALAQVVATLILKGDQVGIVGAKDKIADIYTALGFDATVVLRT